VGWRPGPSPIAKHGVWLAVGLLLFHPLGLYALLAHFIQIDPEYNRGNRAGAQAHADSVRRLGQIALVVGIVVIGLYLTLVISTSR
jgi:mannose/fructose/N-acetylgalactosamine-specific phosphotransferase system component IID